MKANSKQAVAKALRERILKMELEPGKLIDEVRLAAELGLSRTPLREVIQLLCGQGYLVQEENRGAKVASMDLETMHHFFRAAPMLYASVTQLAADTAKPADIAALKDIQQAYRKAIREERIHDTAIENHRFHAWIGEIGGSPYLQPSLDRLLIDHTRISHIFYRSKTPDDAARIEEAARQHDEMIAAIEERRSQDAAELALKHWDLSRGRIEHFVQPDPFPYSPEDQKRAV
ncbi:MAG: GntR family transcriptional regulator [Pseudomonadota bacterium]